MNFFDLNDILSIKSEPNFNNLLKILNGSRPDRPTLFEFSISVKLCEKLAGNDIPVEKDDPLYPYLSNIYGYRNAGYDFSSIILPDFSFQSNNDHVLSTKSLNEGAVIKDRRDYENYRWPDPEKADYSLLDKLEPYLPEGMKLMVFSPDGILENTIKLIGFDSLCMMIYEDEELLTDIFNEVGSRLLKYYSNCIKHNSIGILFGNDDWGFKNQTMISPEHLRQFVFPWYKKIVSISTEFNKPAAIHSCGQIFDVIDDISTDINFSGKHSFEDNILPVEDAYKKYNSKISILGGIDIDFLCRAPREKIYERSKNMLKLSREFGRYALGSGNSIPDYVPVENYFAMIQAVLEER